MGTITIHPAEAYLRNEQNPTSLYVRIGGQRRRLFINRDENLIGIIATRKRNRGYILPIGQALRKYIIRPMTRKQIRTGSWFWSTRNLHGLPRIQTTGFAQSPMRIWISPFTRTTSLPVHASTASVSGLPQSKNIAERQKCTSSDRQWRTKKVFPHAALTSVAMTVRCGASHEIMATWQQASARNTGIAATVITTCLSMTNIWSVTTSTDNHSIESNPCQAKAWYGLSLHSADSFLFYVLLSPFYW